jgi:hypothetical protein
VLGRSRNVTVLERSRSAMEPGSCGSAENKFEAPSTNAWAADCKSVAAYCRDCCYSTGDCKNAAAHCRDCCCSTGDCKNAAAHCRRGCYRTAYPVASAVVYGRCCSWAPKSAKIGHWILKAVHLRAPKADDWLAHVNRGLFAPRSSPADPNFRILPARGLDHWRFPALPTCVCYRPRAANQCCLRHLWNCGSSCSSPKAAGSATIPAAANSSRMAVHCPDDRS